MFAIFDKIDGLDWNSFSVNYRNSLYFCLHINNQILDKSNEEFPVCENKGPEPVCKNVDQSAYFKTLPKKQYVKRSKASMCRELLKQINSLTFLVLEEETLDKLEEDLRDVVEDLKLQAPHDAGLIKESFSYVRSSPKQGIYRDPLPKRKIKKSALSGRVGIGAEKRRTAIKLNIKDTPKKQPRTEEELAPEDGALYDSDFQPPFFFFFFFLHIFFFLSTLY